MKIGRLFCFCEKELNITQKSERGLKKHSNINNLRNLVIGRTIDMFSKIVGIPTAYIRMLFYGKT